MPFVTYKSYANPHVTIHSKGCSQIRKRGGEHRHGQGAYHEHESYDDAKQYAIGTSLRVHDCSYCKPTGINTKLAHYRPKS